jgi:hypothetical protein
LLYFCQLVTENRASYEKLQASATNFLCKIQDGDDGPICPVSPVMYWMRKNTGLLLTKSSIPTYEHPMSYMFSGRDQGPTNFALFLLSFDD